MKSPGRNYETSSFLLFRESPDPARKHLAYMVQSCHLRDEVAGTAPQRKSPCLLPVGTYRQHHDRGDYHDFSNSCKGKAHARSSTHSFALASPL